MPAQTPDTQPNPFHGSLGDLALDVNSITKSFGTRKNPRLALKDVSLQCPRGRVLGLIGPDGAGKSTLIRLIAGLLRPDSGRIRALGLDLAENPRSVQTKLGYMPQRFGLYEDLTIHENMELYADLHGVPSRERSRRYQQLLPMTGLAPFGSRLAGRLSGGMKQKLGLACTLVRAPELLLLDEPTVGVDPLSRRELWSIINRLVREEGMSVLVSTLYLDESVHCDGVVILHEGRVLGQGTPEWVAQQARGRVWVVDVPGMRPRQVQAQLAQVPGVADAVVQGEQVRLIWRDHEEPDADRLLDGLSGASLQAQPPRFEDGFIALLRGLGPQAMFNDPQNALRSMAAFPIGPGSAKSQTPVITVRDVLKQFGSFTAVNRVSFEVNRGEVFGLLGANGAGKSTLFRMLCGLLPPTSGVLLVAGVDARKAAAAARARLGYMSQKFSLYGYLSVRQNLRFFASAYGLGGRTRTRRIDAAIAEFQLEHYADSPSADLPLGFKQRLALACAMMHEPDILFLDEPTSGVDPLARREFWRRITALAERGVTVLVTTHFLEEAESCDRMAILASGSILALGAPREVKRAAGATREAPLTMEEAFIRLIERASHPGTAP